MDLTKIIIIIITVGKTARYLSKSNLPYFLISFLLVLAMHSVKIHFSSHPKVKGRHVTVSNDI